MFNQGFTLINKTPNEANLALIIEEANKIEIDLYLQSIDIRSNTLDYKSEERPIRPSLDSNKIKTNIIIKLFRKTTNYYKDFK